jgi:hypothetical protein
MADAVTSQTLVDGARNAVMKFTNVSDGTGESAVLKVDVSALSGAPTAVKINKIEYTTEGMSVNILWDATTDVLAVHLPQNSSDTLDFCDAGGLINNGGAGKTGDIMFTTVGHSALADDRYTVVLHMVKKW